MAELLIEAGLPEWIEDEVVARRVPGSDSGRVGADADHALAAIVARQKTDETSRRPVQPVEQNLDGLRVAGQPE